MTLLVRDGADIVDDQTAYHPAAGVDMVIATDHRSVDGTTEILEKYEAEGKRCVLYGTGRRRTLRAPLSTPTRFGFDAGSST